jgi:hypothetical protein
MAKQVNSNLESLDVVIPKLAIDVTPEQAPKAKINLAFQRDKDREMVKGIFRFHEVPGGSMSFTMLLHKGDQLKNYTLTDGEVATIPLGVAKHLNKNLAYPVHGYTQDENGKSMMKVTQMIRRCSFQSLQFMDMEDLTPVGMPA